MMKRLFPCLQSESLRRLFFAGVNYPRIADPRPLEAAGLWRFVGWGIDPEYDDRVALYRETVLGAVVRRVMNGRPGAKEET